MHVNDFCALRFILFAHSVFFSCHHCVWSLLLWWCWWCWWHFILVIWLCKLHWTCRKPQQLSWFLEPVGFFFYILVLLLSIFLGPFLGWLSLFAIHLPSHHLFFFSLHGFLQSLSCLLMPCQANTSVLLVPMFFHFLFPYSFCCVSSFCPFSLPCPHVCPSPMSTLHILVKFQSVCAMSSFILSALCFTCVCSVLLSLSR